MPNQLTRRSTATQWHVILRYALAIFCADGVVVADCPYKPNEVK